MKLNKAKIFIILFWLISFGSLIAMGLDDHRGFVYLLLCKFIFQFFVIIGICGILSCILEKFYENIIYKYFMFSFALVACFFFLDITAQLCGIQKPFYKGIDVSFYGLLVIYFINILNIVWILFGIYGIFKNNMKIARLGFFASVSYIFLYILFYGQIVWKF